MSAGRLPARQRPLVRKDRSAQHLCYQCIGIKRNWSYQRVELVGCHRGRSSGLIAAALATGEACSSVLYRSRALERPG